jgi:dihydroxy-acid dehydratase
MEKYMISLDIGDEEMEERKKTMKLRERSELKGYHARYVKMVSSADKGAIVC